MAAKERELRRRSSRQHHQYVTDTSGGKPKYATRHLAALDFLQSITMVSEYRILESHLENGDLKDSSHFPGIFSEGTHHHDLLEKNRGEDILNSVAGGKKLDGRSAPLVTIPSSFRYRMTRFNEQSAVIKNWEESVLRKTPLSVTASQSPQPPSEESSGLLNSRAFFSRAHGYPICLMSVIGYAPEVEKARMEQRAEYILGANTYKIPQRDWRGISYRHCFQQDAEDEHPEDEETSGTASGDYVYDPNALDDPEMIQGKHRYVLRGDAITGPVISSVILYVNRKDLKDDLNQKFRERHPQLPQSLTLSKIRKVKKVALVGCTLRGMEVSTVAIAFISFELLCLKGLVTKANRRLSMAVCLILAAKFNEPLEGNRFEAALEFADQQWSIPKKEIFEAEFGALVHLNFSLHYPQDHLYLMYSRLLKQIPH